MLTAYMLFRRFVFAASGRSLRSELGRFTAVNLVTLLLVWAPAWGWRGSSFLRLEFTWHSDDVAHLIGVLVPAATSFVGQRYYSFGRT